MTTKPTAATFKSLAPAPIDCQGSVEGREVTGRGEWVIERMEAGAATCQQSSGSGRARFVLPTAEDPLELINDFTFEQTGLGASFSGSTLSGSMTFVPLPKGDCVNESLTVVDLILSGASPR